MSPRILLEMAAPLGLSSLDEGHMRVYCKKMSCQAIRVLEGTIFSQSRELHRFGGKAELW